MATPKQKAFVSAMGAGLSGFIAFVANTPPSQQAGILAALTDCVPIDWRPNVAALGKLISELTIAYAIYQASHSGPATKPATDAQTGETTGKTTVRIIGSNYDPVSGQTVKTVRLTP